MPDLAPLPASSAYHSLALVMYITPSTTTGVTCRAYVLGRPKIHLGVSRAALALLICASVL